MNSSQQLVKPLLLVPVYRGGARFQRCLRSIEQAGTYFSCVVLSINGSADSPDMREALAFKERVSFPVLVFNTRTELDSMNHTCFWAQQLQDHQFSPDQLIMWLGHDDELDVESLRVVCPEGMWHIDASTMVLGPWKLRHESVNELYKAPENEFLETWTCFPSSAGIPMRSMDWVCDQLLHPTYLNLTGGIFPLQSVIEIIEFRVHKVSGMRMEMTLATAPDVKSVTELPHAVTIVYGRADSDRATIPRANAVKDDRHLLLWLSRYSLVNSRSRKRFLHTVIKLARLKFKIAIGKAQLPNEDWVVRGD